MPRDLYAILLICSLATRLSFATSNSNEGGGGEGGGGTGGDAGGGGADAATSAGSWPTAGEDDTPWKLTTPKIIWQNYKAAKVGVELGWFKSKVRNFEKHIKFIVNPFFN